MIIIEYHGEQATWDGQWRSKSKDLLLLLNAFVSEFSYSDTLLKHGKLRGLDAAIIKALPFKVKIIENKPEQVTINEEAVY
jgi:hypothetical protein